MLLLEISIDFRRMWTTFGVCNDTQKHNVCALNKMLIISGKKINLFVIVITVELIIRPS